LDIIDGGDDSFSVCFPSLLLAIQSLLIKIHRYYFYFHFPNK
jgi:hypothetical protein